MKRRISLPVLAVFLLAISFAAGNKIYAQSQTPEKARIVRKSQIQYLSWFPAEYKKHRHEKFPLLIFLHGSGERGTDITKVKAWGPPSFVESRPDFPFIVISPQCPEGQWWNIEDLNILLTRLLKKLRVDPDRVYLTGLSMGGFGTWTWATTYPNRFAAIAPVCGGGDIQMVWNLKGIPVWAFHGQDDPVVPVIRTTEMVDAVTKIGGNAKATIYPGVGHDSWKNAYADEELYKWLLSHKRQK
jgi:predicted peptidase